MGLNGVKKLTQSNGEIIVEKVWREFVCDRNNQGLRNTLILYYFEFLLNIARAIHRKLPAEVELDDLVSSGLFGLVDALNKFDPQNGACFKTFSQLRIRGAILDDIRKMDYVPRISRSRTKMIEQSMNRLESRLGRKPSNEELAEDLHISNKMLNRWFEKHFVSVQTLSLNKVLSQDNHTNDKDVLLADRIADVTTKTNLDEVARQEVRTMILKGLDRTDRLIVLLYYFESLTMKEIGDLLNMSESRVSQRLSSITLRLKARIELRTFYRRHISQTME